VLAALNNVAIESDPGRTDKVVQMNSRNLLGPTFELKPTGSGARDLDHPIADHHLSAVNQQFILFDYWRVLVKRGWVILGVLLIALAAAVLISLRMTPLYRAAGEITIDRENPNPLGLKENGTASTSDPDDPAIDLATQVRILKSNSLALLAIRKLQSTGQLTVPPHASDVQSGAPLTGAVRPNQEQQDRLVRKFKGDLQVVAIPDTRVVQIAYVSPDPHAAANAVNAMINAYIEQNLTTHFETTTQAADWLTKQIADLQIKTEISEQKLVRYQRDHGIVGTDEKQNVITSKLDDLNKTLTEAEADRIQKQAIYELTKSGDPEAVGAVSQDTFLQSLHAQRAGLENELAQANVQLGSAYPKIVELKNRIQQLDRTIATQLKQTLGKIHNDYVGAVGREKILRRAFDQQKEEAGQLNQNAIEYNLLKRDADSNRRIYDSLTQKLKEAGLSAGLRSTNVHIVDSASVPPAPFTPDIPRNVGIGLLIGLAGGIAVAFVLEGLDTTVRTPDQAEATSFLSSLAVIPLAVNGRLASYGTYTSGRRLVSGLTNNNGHEETALLAYTRPNSQIAEAYRGLRTSVLLSLPDAPPKIILITSPLPQDGKTTTSIGTAIVMAQEGRRVLLVDADLRHPSICKALGISSRAGLTTILAGYRSPESVILPSPRLQNLFVLPSGPTSPCPSELLSSDHMKQLLVQWREMFDHVIIDSPPVLAVTDSVRLSIEADAVLMVIRSSQTSKAALRRASIVLAQVKANVLGIVMNGLDLNSADRHYYYYSNAKYGNEYYGADETDHARA
jgi:succinoglycan biosynthesis transport protein ExoP